MMSLTLHYCSTCNKYHPDLDTVEQCEIDQVVEKVTSAFKRDLEIILHSKKTAK